MANEPIEDYALDFSGGQNASQIPARLNPNEYAYAVNVSAYTGDITPRYGYVEQNLTFKINKEFRLPKGASRTYESIFYGGRFQALIPYSVGDEFYLIIIISGIIFIVNHSTLEVTLIEITDGSKINEFHNRVNWSPAGRFLVIFDYPAYPVIIEGFTARRADPAKMEVPVSVLGTYNQNRLLVANIANEWTASDPAAYGFPEGPISFTEVETPASNFFGQVFQLSTNFNNDNITAMGFLQVVDTSTGIGPALVSTDSSIYSYHTELPRADWQINTSGNSSVFGSIFVINPGCAGPRAFCNVNSDIFFIAPDGQIHSASMSRDEQGKWSKRPLSREVQNWIGIPDQTLTAYSVIAYFKNKVIVAVNPYRTLCVSTEVAPIFDVAFGGFVVLELDNVSTLTQDSPPAWGSLWTGIRPMDIVVNNDHCFVMSKDDGRNRLWEIRPDIRYDIIGPEQKIRRIRSRLYTREYDFNHTSFVNKTLNSIDLGLYNVQGDFDLKIKYRPSHSRKFYDWTSFHHEAPWRTCKVPEGCEWNGLLGHQFRELNLGSPIENACDPVTQETSDVFRRVQLFLEISGIYWELHEFRLRGMLMPQNETERVCEPFPPAEVCGDCNTDWDIPDLCQENLKT